MVLYAIPLSAAVLSVRGGISIVPSCASRTAPSLASVPSLFPVAALRSSSAGSDRWLFLSPAWFFLLRGPHFPDSPHVSESFVVVLESQVLVQRVWETPSGCRCSSSSSARSFVGPSLARHGAQTLALWRAWPGAHTHSVSPSGRGFGGLSSSPLFLLITSSCQAPLRTAVSNTLGHNCS